jgi:hypothetical protein
MARAEANAILEKYPNAVGTFLLRASKGNVVISLVKSPQNITHHTVKREEGSGAFFIKDSVPFSTLEALIKDLQLSVSPTLKVRLTQNVTPGNAESDHYYYNTKV